MPKPSFKTMTLTIAGETTRVVNEDEVKAYLVDINDPSMPDSGWNEGFVTGLDAAGVLTVEQYEDLMEFVANL